MRMNAGKSKCENNNKKNEYINKKDCVIDSHVSVFLNKKIIFFLKKIDNNFLEELIML